MNNFDLLIIGAGPSGIYAATYAALKNMKVLIIESSSIIGGQTRQLYGHKNIYEFPGYLKITGEKLIEKLLEQQNKIQNNIQYLINTRLIKWKRLKNNTFTIKLSNNTNIKTKYIIISSGNGSLSPTPLENNLISSTCKSENISYYVDSFDKYKNLDVVILGGGDSAVEWANQIAKTKIAKSVSIIHRRSAYRANPKYVLELKTNKIKEYLNYQINKIDNHNLIIQEIEKQQKFKIKYDKIIVQYGLKKSPNINNEWNTIKKIGNKIITNRNQQTNEKNIYAIGLATYYDCRPDLILTGMAEAIIAIKHIYNKINPYDLDYIQND